MVMAATKSGMSGRARPGLPQVPSQGEFIFPKLYVSFARQWSLDPAGIPPMKTRTKTGNMGTVTCYQSRKWVAVAYFPRMNMAAAGQGPISTKAESRPIMGCTRRAGGRQENYMVSPDLQWAAPVGLGEGKKTIWCPQITRKLYGVPRLPNRVIGVTATASDGTVTKVEFYVGGVKIGEDAAGPYEYTWSNVSLGTHTLTARATYDNGAMLTSDPITVEARTPGDANGNGAVDAADYITLKQNFGTSSGATWSMGDFNGDGRVDYQDLTALYEKMGRRK
jgi:hypothetical protein